MMRRSLFARLLALSLTVAVVAVAATAWLAAQTTSSRLIGEFTRSLEADAFVYTRLLDFAATHADWRGVDPLLSSLAARTGRRIVLATTDGDAIADSALEGGRQTRPPIAAALVDPFSPLHDTKQTSGANSRWDWRLQAADSVPALSVSVPEVRAERDRRRDDVVACVTAQGHDVDIDDRPRVRDEPLAALPEDVLDTCQVHALTGPTPTEVRLARDLSSSLSSCLSAAGAGAAQRDEVVSTALRRLPTDPDGALVDPVGGHAVDTSTTPEDGPAPASSPTGTIAAAGVADCVQRAYRDVYGEFVADPALLYLGDGADDGLLAAAGGTRLVTAVILVLAVLAGVTVLGGRRLVQPIRSLTAAAHRMGTGDRGARVVVSGHDDVARLGAAFNQMAESLESNERQRRAMAADIAHELRSPLTRLRGTLEGAQDELVEVDDEFLSLLLDETALVQRLVTDLQELALAEAGQLRLHTTPLSAARLAAAVVSAQKPRAEAAGVSLTLSTDGPCDIEADPDRLRQALGNLVSNALAHTPAGGQVSIHVGHHGDGRAVVLSVRDTGAGIAREHLPHVFDRFYRADPSRSRTTGGSGLGLAITRSLVEAHGGTVEAASRLGHGSTFTITLPPEDAAEAGTGP